MRTERALARMARAHREQVEAINELQEENGDLCTQVTRQRAELRSIPTIQAVLAGLEVSAPPPRCAAHTLSALLPMPCNRQGELDAAREELRVS